MNMTPDCTEEKWLELDELCDALARTLPDRSCKQTIYRWIEQKPYGMPSIPKPGSGSGTGKRTRRWYILSEVKEWLRDPAAYWARRSKAS